MTSPRRSTVTYPALLQDAIAHARRFVRTLRALEEEASADESALVWLEGRPDEVRVFTLDVLRDWSSDEISTTAAANAIGEYLSALHASLEGWYARWYAPSCCGPLSAPRQSGIRARSEVRPTRRAGSLADTMADVPAAESREIERPAASVRRVSARAVGVREMSRRTVTMGGIGVMRLRMLG